MLLHSADARCRPGQVSCRLYVRTGTGAFFINFVRDLLISVLSMDSECISNDVCSSNDAFRIDRNIIQEVQKESQALELQALDISVYDQNTFEQGILAQVDKALKASDDHQLSDSEEGEVISDTDSTPKNTIDAGHALRCLKSPPKERDKKDNVLTELEKYLRCQAAFEQTRKKNLRIANEEKKVSKKGCLTDVPSPVKKRAKKVVNLSPKKRKKSNKEVLGSFVSQEKIFQKSNEQPGESSYIYLNKDSDSEYIPSDGSHSSDEDGRKAKRKKKPVKRKVPQIQSSHLERVKEINTSDSDWVSSDDDSPKRKGKKELDDGDIDTYHRRLKICSKQKLPEGFHELTEGYKCPIYIWNKLYQYQQEGVKWLWNLDIQLCGGLLGDEMGLGKTIQVIAFLAGLYVSRLEDTETGYIGLGPSLIVCPTTVMHQWVREFHVWFPLLRVAILHESGTYNGKVRTQLINALHYKKTGVLVTSYTGLLQHKEAIISKKWHYVILDEGHKIRNPEAQVTSVTKELDTPHRLILSGSPLQNSLRELWSLFDFIYPGKLGTLPVFLSTFAVPITQGGYTNASQTQVLAAYKCAMILKDTITPYLLRRMKSEVGVSADLPGKTEQVLFCRLTDEQRSIYKAYIETLNMDEMSHGKSKVFVPLMVLRKICNHPDLYTGGPSRSFQLDSDSSANDEDKFGYARRSGKMIVVETLLRIWKEQGHRVLLFTQSKKMLLILENLVMKKDYKYLKLDGSTTIASRQPLIDRFNKDNSYFLMLLTTRVGGLGVNLTGANRVVIYDPDWNPATDTQARERAWRIGQKKDVTIYRLVTAGTIEEKIYHRQIYKQFLSNKVLNNPKQRRFFKSNDLLELFSLSETIKGGTTETAAIFAGTGSEVKLTGKAKYSPKKCAVAPQVTFSESKITEMKKLAHLLSKKFASRGATTKLEDKVESSGNDYSIYGPDGTLVAKTHGDSSECSEKSKTNILKEHNETGISTPHTSLLYNNNNSEVSDKTEKTQSNKVENNCECLNDKIVAETSSVSGQTVDKCSSQPELDNTSNKDGRWKLNKSSKENGKRKKTVGNNKEQFLQFEGETVPHLVKCKKKKRKKKHSNDDDDNEIYESQDDYVLQKLFSKSGIETAIRHDTIMDGGPNDYAIVEAEAEKVAEDAIKALKESRSQVPTYRKPLFKSMIRKRPLNNPQVCASSLIKDMKKRDLNLDSSDNEKTLLTDVISWLCSQGGTSSTDQLVKEFSPKVGAGQSPLFKSLLKNIATFFRAPDNIGYWTIKDEFKTVAH